MQKELQGFGRSSGRPLLTLENEQPGAAACAAVVVAIALSIVTCLKGKLTLGLLSIFLPPVGIVSAYRLARPGSIWAQLFYSPEQIARARTRFDPAASHLEVLRHRLTDLLAGRHDIPTPQERIIPRPRS